ncbi:hypothetical protein DL95DRAFT_512598, partial [Leptodontidium sp. 2 PMI_412]
FEPSLEVYREKSCFVKASSSKTFTAFPVTTLARPTTMLRRMVLSLIATKILNRATRHVVALKPSIVARSFHISPSYHSNCDFGRPCQCT